MSNKMSNKHEKLPTKANEYWAFVLWKSLPAQLKKLPPAKITEMGFDMQVLQLLRIKTNDEFAQNFDISRDTLTDWQRLPRFGDDIRNTIDKTVLRTYKSAIDHNFTMKTLEEADASRVKLWKQLYEGWTEKGEIEHTGRVEHSSLIEVGEISKSDILNLVIGKVAKKQGMNAVDLMDKMRDGYYKELDVEDAQVVDFTFPSDQVYDFNEIEEGRKAINKDELPEPNGELSKASENLKATLLQRLKEISDTEANKNKLTDAINRVKKKGKGNDKK